MRGLQWLLLFALGCESSTTTGSLESESVIDVDDRVVVADDGSNVPDRYRPLLDAIGRGLLPGDEPHCTFTHLGNGIVVTAGHCLTEFSFIPGNPEETCANLLVQWGYRTEGVPRLVSKCEQVLAVQYERTEKIDYAFVRVTPVPPNKVDFDAVSKPPMGRAVTIFGHPHGRSLTWSGECRVEPPKDPGDVTFKFTHTCDTETGNSGSAIIDVETLRVVGIHVHSVERDFQRNGATYLSATPLAGLL